MIQETDSAAAPHGPLEAITDHIFRVEGTLEKGPPIKRVMTVVRLSGGDLMIHSAIALAEPAMKELEALGPVAYVIVPNRYHRLDAARYSQRYPQARVLCPPGSRKQVEKVTRVDGTYRDFPGDQRVRLEVLDGVGEIEGVVIVEDGGEVTLVLNDVVFNMPHRRGVGGFILRRITGSSGGPRISRLVRLGIIKDKAALRRNLERLAALPGLRRIIVSHHEVIDDEPARVLRDVAATL